MYIGELFSGRWTRHMDKPDWATTGIPTKEVSIPKGGEHILLLKQSAVLGATMMQFIRALRDFGLSGLWLDNMTAFAHKPFGVPLAKEPVVRVPWRSLLIRKADDEDW